MRIAVDARELAGHATGVGRYLREILAAWGRLPEAGTHEIVLCSPEPIDVSAFGGAAVTTVTRPGGGGTAWEQLVLPGLLRDAGADVLFAPGYTAPLRSPVPVVLVVHDVSFAAHPEWFSWREGARRRTITRLAAAQARRVLTISEFSKREIVAHLGTDREKITVIYPGLTQIPVGRAFTARLANDKGSPHEGSPHERQSVLFVGSIFGRRHVPELIQGFARIAASHPALQLDIVGENRTSPPLDLGAIAHGAGVGDRVHLRSYVSEEELERLYGRAGVLAFLSDYEGFGLTPLEALGAGVPIIVLDTPVTREVYGEAAFYIAAPEPSRIAAAIAQAVFDDAARKDVLAARGGVLARYSWDDCARRVLAVLTGAAA